MTDADRAVDAAQGVDEGARAAWTHLATASLPKGWSRELTQDGFARNDLRFLRGGDWMFSAVPNQGWVLWYARRPAVKAGVVDPDAMTAAFADARTGNKGEIKLRLHDAAAARTLLDWSLGRG